MEVDKPAPILEEEEEEEDEEEEEEDDKGDMDTDYVPPGEDDHAGASTGRQGSISGLLTTPLKSPPAKEYADKLVRQS